MNRNNPTYSGISSFEDFKLEKERLLLKVELIETRISFNFEKIRSIFSISSMLFSVAKEYIMPKISEFLGGMFKKA
ncbi:MAG: hypothetical protein WCX31_22090 [Salinivirgaceae bacterium]